jgi:cell fate regulator YaaT (PSP1 superfamily)
MEFPFKVGDLAVVEVDKGEHIGKVCHLGQGGKNPLEVHFNVIRKARPEDIKSFGEIALKEKEALKICHQKVNHHNLQMKLVDVEYQFDLKKLTFYFTANGRVDFRELVKDLAAHFRVRIDLRQIGARDETRRFCGYGVCGVKLCCATFIEDFLPVSTQMAKVQNLSLNPQKLSGVCGRLKCCLRYELEFYMAEMKKYPLKDSVYQTPRGPAFVEKVDIFHGLVWLKFENGDMVKYLSAEVQQFECLKLGPQLDTIIEEVSEEIDTTLEEPPVLYDITDDFE